MPDEKYIQIDKDGKPDYINKAAGKKIPGVPDDDDLCFIQYKKVKIPKKKQNDDDGDDDDTNDDGYEFTCVPSDKCKEKNKDVDKKRDDLDKEIKDLEKKIGELENDIDDKKKASQKAANQKDLKKKQAELTKKRSERHAIPNDCLLKYIGGDNKISKDRLTVDEIKNKKIEYVFCYCQKVKLPEAK